MKKNFILNTKEEEIPKWLLIKVPVGHSEHHILEIRVVPKICKQRCQTSQVFCQQNVGKDTTFDSIEEEKELAYGKTLLAADTNDLCCRDPCRQHADLYFSFHCKLRTSRARIKHISLNLMLQKGTYVVAPKS